MCFSFAMSDRESLLIGSIFGGGGIDIDIALRELDTQLWLRLTGAISVWVCIATFTVSIDRRR